MHQSMPAHLGTLGAGHERLADIADGEGRRRLDVIPVLLGEGVDAAKQKGEEDSRRTESATRVPTRARPGPRRITPAPPRPPARPAQPRTSSSCRPSFPWKDLRWKRNRLVDIQHQRNARRAPRAHDRPPSRAGSHGERHTATPRSTPGDATSTPRTLVLAHSHGSSAGSSQRRPAEIRKRASAAFERRLVPPAEAAPRRARGGKAYRFPPTGD